MYFLHHVALGFNAAKDIQYIIPKAIMGAY